MNWFNFLRNFGKSYWIFFSCCVMGYIHVLFQGHFRYFRLLRRKYLSASLRLLLEFKNRKIEMKKWNEEENEEFFEEEYFTFQSPNLGKNQTFWNFFWFRWCIYLVSKNNFSENFCGSFFPLKSPKNLIFGNFLH